MGDFFTWFTQLDSAVQIAALVVAVLYLKQEIKYSREQTTKDLFALEWRIKRIESHYFRMRLGEDE